MMLFPEMLMPAAEAAGMKVPDLSKKNSKWNENNYPHFTVYCNCQLGCAIKWGNHWENAKIIAAIPEDKIKTITHTELFALGFDP